MADVVGIVGSGAALWSAINIKTIKRLYESVGLEPTVLAKIVEISGRLVEHHGIYEASKNDAQTDLRLLLTSVRRLGKESKPVKDGAYALIKEINLYLEKEPTKERLWTIYGMTAQTIQDIDFEQKKRNFSI